MRPRVRCATDGGHAAVPPAAHCPPPHHVQMGGCSSTPQPWEEYFAALQADDMQKFYAALRHNRSAVNAAVPATGCTPLSCAAARGNLLAVRELLANGANLQRIDAKAGWESR